MGWRDAVFGVTDPAEPRVTYFGYVLGAGGRTRAGPVDVEVDLRWTFLDDTSYRPSTFTLGVSYPFWRVGPDT